MIRKKKDSDHKMQRQPLPDKNQAEGLLCQSSETLSALIAASPLAIIALDRFVNVLIWNPAAERLFGWKEKEVIGRPYPLVPESELADFKALIEREFEGIRHNAVELKRLHKDGTLIDVNIWTAPLHDADGRMYGVLGMLADISERKKAEQQMRLQSAALQASANAIMITDIKGKIQWINNAFTNLTGFNPDEVIGKNPRQLVKSGKHDQAFYKNLWETILAGNIWNGETINRRKDGSIYTEDQTISPVLNELGNISHFIAIKQDITERKIADEKIRRLNRLYKVTSSINTLIIRISEREELFREACMIAVNEGQFRMAWIGLYSNEQGKLIPQAWDGHEDGFLQYIQKSIQHDEPDKAMPSIQAVHLKQQVIINKISDIGEVVWKKEALTRGYQSVISLPLLVSSKVVGVISLYASVQDFFDDEEIKLLTELAGDISFALYNIAQNESLEYLASYDPLTGLPNRTLFYDHLNSVLERARSGNKKVGLLVCDLKQFRNINNVYGRQKGDRILQETATRMREMTSDPVNIGRITSNYFAMILHDIGDSTGIAYRFENTLFPSLNKPFLIDNEEIQASFTGGIAVFPTDGGDAETLYRNAEAALKKAKASNQQYLFYEAEMTDRISEILLMESKLRHALDKDQFVLHYQPKISGDNHKITGLEALIRWNNPDTGLVPPGKFIPILEETGMILDVGNWAIENALKDMQQWQSSGIEIPRIAVNVSTLQLQQKNFVDVITNITGRYGGKLCGLDLEVTESLLMQDIDKNIEKLVGIRELGINIAIDDFGTGYSSLSYLAKLPVNALKIDRSFIMYMDKFTESMSIVSSIIGLAHSFKLKVIAEGVETEEQSKLLRLLKCDEMQGFLFSKPLPSDEIFELLRSGKTL